MSNPFIQPLEGRLCLSVSFQQNTSHPHNPSPSISLDDGILIVRGGSGNDRISFSFPSGVEFVGIPPVEVPPKIVIKLNRKSASVELDKVKQIRVDAGAGNDRVFIIKPYPDCPERGQPAVFGNDTPTLIFGGPGDDLLLGGNGDDWLWGDAGNDSARAGKGHDSANRIEEQKSIEDTMPDSTVVTRCRDDLWI